MVAGFNEALRNAAQLDLFTGIIPFLILFIVFFLSLGKAPLIGGDDNKPAQFILAGLLAGLFSNFLLQTPVYQSFTTQFVGRLGIGLLALIGIYVLIGFTPYDPGLDGDATRLIAVLATVLAFGAFAGAGGLGLYLPDVMIPGLEIRTSGISDFIFEDGGWALAIPLAVLLYFLVSSVANTEVGQTGNTAAEQILDDLLG